MTRPVDGMAVALFGRTPIEAQLDGICIRCKRGVNPDDWPEEDQREYDISALCPDCYAWVMAEEPA